MISRFLIQKRFNETNMNSNSEFRLFSNILSDKNIDGDISGAKIRLLNPKISLDSYTLYFIRIMFFWVQDEYS